MDEDELAQSLKEELECFGISIGKNRQKILAKSSSLCRRFNVDSEEFVELWIAFAAAKSINELDEEILDVFEKQELSSRAAKVDVKFDPASLNLGSSQEDSKVHIYRKEDTYAIDDDAENEMETDDISHQILQDYGASEQMLQDYGASPRLPKKSEPKLRKKPSAVDNVKASVKFSPATYSPSAQAESASYAARTKAGDSVVRYKCKDSDYWNEVFNDSHQPVQAKATQHTEKLLQVEKSRKLKFMHQKTTSLASIFNDVINTIGLSMLEKEDKELEDLRVSTVEDCWYIGRIRNDDGRLSQGSCFLEGEMNVSGGHIVPLDLSNVEEYRLFPGQIVIIKGKNELGKCLRASEIIVPLPLPMPSIEPSRTHPLNVIIACGPYTPSDSLQSEPLMDLIKVLKTDKPHVCILMGPFIDPSHPMIVAGDVADTFEDMFENTVKVIKRSVEDLQTHIVLIPSFKDAHHLPVYPTPPYSVNAMTSNSKISFFPDPATFEVAGITFGVTSTDILRHFSMAEISKSTIADRMGGLSKLILSQRNFYPLYPPDESVPLDADLWKNYGGFTSTPHILIAPSDLRCFIKDIEGTIVVNPERLTRGKSGGSYARLQVKLPASVVDNVTSVADFCCGEIVKI